MDIFNCSKAKIKNKGLLILCSILAMLLFSKPVYSDVLFGEEYYETLRKYIAQSEKSIVVAMYFIIMEDESPVNALLDDLIAAKNRGVDVKVVLEDAKLGESLPAYNKLKERGIDIRTDLPGKRLHIKGVIIDGRYVFIGSANWSRAAIEDNYEATLFIDSKADAQDLTRFIEGTTVKDAGKVEYEGVALSGDFLLSPKKGRLLLKKHSKKQFDLYLLFRKIYTETGQTTFKIDEKALVEQLGYKVPKNLGSYKSERTFYHDTLRNFLKRLKKDGFIDYEKDVVTLKIDNIDQDIVIPYEYWKYGYDKALSMRAKYLYLICLYESSRSVQYPYWFHSQQDMAKLYGIATWTISKGLIELEKAGILEVTRSKVRPPDFSARKANIYKLLPLSPLGK